MQETERKNYVRHLTEMGEIHTIVAKDDILTTNGIKLISSGARVNSSFYEKLIKHKLLIPIEESLNIKDCLTHSILEEKAKESIKTNGLLASMQKNVSKGILLHSFFSSLNIPDILLFKLTVLEKQLPIVFNHSLNVALASIYIGLELNQNEETIKNIAIAGLFHDIGLLHIAIDLSDSNKELNENDRKKIYSHPIIANLILKTFPNYQVISSAVMEHHERMDGSGYPQGLSGDQINIVGQILIVAELAISLTEKKTNYGYINRLQAILKFNNNQYPHEIVKILLKLLKTIKNTTDNTTISLTKKIFLNKLSSIWVVINAWDYKHDEGLGVPFEISNYISNRIEELTHALNMSGLTLSNISLSDDDLNDILNDAEEMLALIDEATYQLKNIYHEIIRRWPERTSDEDTETSITKWLVSIQKILMELGEELKI